MSILRGGVLPYQHIKKMMSGGAIINGEEERINPASLDLTISEIAYKLKYTFLPLPDESFEKSFSSAEPVKQPLPAKLERGIPYLLKLRESLNLSKAPNVYGFCNPKSTTGRVDMHVRIVTKGNSRYDTVPEKYEGNMWLLVKPQSFPIMVSPGERLAQVRFFDSDTRITETELAPFMNSADGLLYDRHGRKLSYEDIKISDKDGGIILTFDKKSNPAAFECRGKENTLIFGSVCKYNQKDFFETVPRLSDGSVILKSGSFYIFASEEFVRVPPYLACEMVPMEEKSGEFRAHYAGFIDPGWGYGKYGFGKGRPLTLEVRPFEGDIIIRPGQPIAKIMFEKILEVPAVHYDSKDGSNYIESCGPRLSKHFKV